MKSIPSTSHLPFADPPVRTKNKLVLYLSITAYFQRHFSAWMPYYEGKTFRDDIFRDDMSSRISCHLEFSFHEFEVPGLFHAFFPFLLHLNRLKEHTEGCIVYGKMLMED